MFIERSRRFACIAPWSPATLKIRFGLVRSAAVGRSATSALSGFAHMRATRLTPTFEETAVPSGIAARARRKTARVLIEILPSQDLPQRFCITLSGFQYRSHSRMSRSRALARWRGSCARSSRSSASLLACLITRPFGATAPDGLPASGVGAATSDAPCRRPRHPLRSHPPSNPSAHPTGGLHGPSFSASLA